MKNCQDQTEGINKKKRCAKRNNFEYFITPVCPMSFRSARRKQTLCNPKNKSAQAHNKRIFSLPFKGVVSDTSFPSTVQTTTSL